MKPLPQNDASPPIAIKAMIAIRERFDRFPKTFTFDCPQVLNGYSTCDATSAPLGLHVGLAALDQALGHRAYARLTDGLGFTALALFRCYDPLRDESNE